MSNFDRALEGCAQHDKGEAEWRQEGNWGMHGGVVYPDQAEETAVCTDGVNSCREILTRNLEKIGNNYCTIRYVVDSAIKHVESEGGFSTRDFWAILQTLVDLTEEEWYRTRHSDPDE